jgi:coproporphyrinogen III oxidase-like Fe-S oxidoreductase
MFEDLQASTQKANMPNKNIQKLCVYIYIHGRQTKVAKEELEEEEPPEQDERQHQTTQLKRATHKNI